MKDSITTNKKTSTTIVPLTSEGLFVYISFLLQFQFIIVLKGFAPVISSNLWRETKTMKTRGGLSKDFKRKFIANQLESDDDQILQRNK